MIFIKTKNYVDVLKQIGANKEFFHRRGYSKGYDDGYTDAEKDQKTTRVAKNTTFYNKGYTDGYIAGEAKIEDTPQKCFGCRINPDEITIRIPTKLRDKNITDLAKMLETNYVQSLSTAKED